MKLKSYKTDYTLIESDREENISIYPTLKYLSPSQRKKSKMISRDWKRFSNEFFSGIYNKI